MNSSRDRQQAEQRSYHSKQISYPPSRRRILLLLLTLSCLGCGSKQEQQILRLATTTSTRDSGLLDQLLPQFEKQHNVRIDVIAAGTGKALKLGENGDVDVVFAHAREAEDAFMAAGHGTRREDVMYNTFNLLGPSADPAEIRELETSAALQKIAAGGFPFISRGDNSGTHMREQLLWQIGGSRPDWLQYKEAGQGMGATLTIAHEMSAYVLTDRGTYLNFRDKIDLVPLTRDSPEIHNPYGIMVVSNEKSPAIRSDLANKFVDYLISPAAQQLIADYRLNGEQLFFPLRLTSDIQQ